MRFVIITGLSGAGKTEAIRAFEDLGYFCVDNLPPTLIPKFAELCAQSEGKVNKIALVIDIRGGQFFDSLFGALENLEAVGFRYDVLFLEATDEVLIRRFKETRRRHPLAPEGTILDGLTAERKKLEQLRGRATRIIDTSHMTARQLKEEIMRAFATKDGGARMTVSVISFGFKHGLPLDADLVFDCRFLPNPHYVASLKNHTGNEAVVADYVLKWPITQRFIAKLSDFVEFLMPHFAKEGKSQVIIGIGCTGGKHRSVTLANVLGDFLRQNGYPVTVEHRDIEKSDGD
ncbi:MAG: RNase adapter RapZ [Syntrophothermus sp.]